MQILYISAEPIRPNQAAATHINEIARGLECAGHQVTVCAARNNQAYETGGLFGRLAGYTYFWFRALKRLRHANVVYARAHFANFPIAAAAYFFGYPIIHEINGTHADVATTHAWLRPFLGIIRLLYAVQFRCADALVAVTPGLASWVRDQAPGVPVSIVPNGANCSVFKPAPCTVTPLQQRYALFFGALTSWHGVEVMIAALNHEAWPDDLHLVVIGQGQLSPMLQRASEQNPKIILIPPVAQEILAGYISGASVGLVPINSIANRGRLGVLPLKLYEMLACGLPVVVTNFPGLADLVCALGAGAVIPPDDPGALARAVASLRSNPPSKQRMSEVASVIKSDHGWDKRAGEIAGILHNVVCERA